MATRGFEFAYSLDGSGATPVIRDFILGAAADHLAGDLMLVQSDDGFIDAVTGSTTLVTCVMQQKRDSGKVTAGTTKGKAAIITREQVWKCSSNASSVDGKIGYNKLQDTLDKNTLDATDVSNGRAIIVENTATDEEGNIILYVVFSDTTFGNV